MKKQKSKKRIYWIVCLVLLIGVGALTYLVWNTHFRQDGAKHLEMAVVEEGEQEETIKTEEESEGKEEEPPKKVTQYEGEDPNEEEELTGVITYAGAAGENLQIRTNIDQFLSGGSCDLTITRDGAVIYTATSGIVAGASTSACQGFDVPMAAIGNGAAQIIINLRSGGKIGTITTEVNL